MKKEIKNIDKYMLGSSLDGTEFYLMKGRSEVVITKKRAKEWFEAGIMLFDGDRSYYRELFNEKTK